MKINIVSSKVLGLTVRESNGDDIARLVAHGASSSHPDETVDNSKRTTASQTAAIRTREVKPHTPNDRQALFGARVVFFDQYFVVVFKTEILTNEGMCIDLEYESRFEVDVALTEEFKSGNFPYVNAPAIAYPYLRAFVSNLTLNAGFAPVMLPSLNFVAMKDKIRAASR